MKSFLRWTVPAAVFIIAALISRSTSTGVALDHSAKAYLDALHRGDGTAACSLLTDSLQSLVSPGFLSGLQDSPSSGTILAGREDSRGRSMTVPLPGGGSRTLWMTDSGDGVWRVSGDTSLDNLLGGASLACIEYARQTVLPAVSAGTPVGDYRCPVSGMPYRLDGDLLVCPSGHLGEGLDMIGDACRASRELVAATVAAFMAAGYPRPVSLAGMHEESGGTFGQPGGYRCPDNGYSFYEITDQGIRCPFHDRTSQIPLPAVDAPGVTAPATEDGSLP
jgi:hypothetical protein